MAKATMWTLLFMGLSIFLVNGQLPMMNPMMMGMGGMGMMGPMGMMNPMMMGMGAPPAQGNKKMSKSEKLLLQQRIAQVLWSRTT